MLHHENEITQGDISLRGISKSQAPALAAIANNRKIWINVMDKFPHPYRLEDAERFIDMLHTQENKLIWAIHYKDELAGMIGVHPATDVYAHSAELGYWLGEAFWKKGIMTKAVEMVITYVFGQTEIIRIYAGLYDYNEGSRKVLEKLGFQYEGTGIHAAKKDGKLVNELRFGLLKNPLP